MKLHSPLSKKDYITSAKERMESHFSFGKDRFTGLFLDSFFSVTYHSGWEWNRRITNEKNTAIGIIKQTDDGCDIQYIQLKGLLAPSSFIPIFIITLAASLFVMMFADHYVPFFTVLAFPFSFTLTLLFTSIEALIERTTEQSDEGAKILKALLIDPSDPFAYLNHINEIN